MDSFSCMLCESSGWRNSGYTKVLGRQVDMQKKKMNELTVEMKTVEVSGDSVTPEEIQLAQSHAFCKYGVWDLIQDPEQSPCPCLHQGLGET